MITQMHRPPAGQRGIVMITSLLLLIVVTIMALAMFRGFGVEEKLAGNTREKQRALSAAISAQQYAEWWIGTGGGSATSAPVVCSTVLNANLAQGQICSNKLPVAVNNNDVTTVPWLIGGASVGVTYVPPNMVPAMVISTTPTVVSGAASNPSYFAKPAFYISDMGPSADASIPGEIYQIDAVGYGGNSTTAAVVESTYAVYVSSSNRTL
jgi:type IV pilus assembly protein PilX